MNKIIALVGESGSGKSTIAELLEKETGFKNVKSFTTRKPRYEGEGGHLFTTVKQYECNKANRFIAAETYFDGNYYWTVKDQLKENCIYIIDPAGIKTLKERVRDSEIVVIYLETSRICRVSRMLKRAGYGLLVPTPQEIYNSISDRATHDDKAFLEFKINKDYDYCVDAEQDIEEVLEGVKFIVVSYGA